MLTTERAIPRLAVTRMSGVPVVANERLFMQNRMSGAALIWLSVFLFACSSSVVRVLVDLGQQNPVDGRNPISFCNVLCAGNISAGCRPHCVSEANNDAW